MAKNIDLNLKSVIHCMKEFISNMEKRDISQEFTFFYNMIFPAFVRMRFEIYQEKASETRNGTNFDFMAEEGTEVKRVVLSPIHNKSRFDHLLTFEANGIVIDSKNWDVLAVPPRAFNPHAKVGKLDAYNVYKVMDGTTITLYWYEEKWCMASTNGYDVSDYKWIGNLTYREAFDEVAKISNFSFDRLNKSCSYSIGFRHNDFHPFLADGPKMWLIQCINLKTLENCTESADIGIEVQKPVSVKSLEEMLRENREAKSKYIAAIWPNSKHPFSPRKVCEEIDSGVLSPPIHYGYILRAKSADDFSPNSNIMLESDLLRKIRQFIYNLPKHNNLSINNETRLNYSILRAYLNSRYRELFIKLFPQFEPQYNRYQMLINSVVSRIIQCYKNKKIRLRLNNPKIKSNGNRQNIVIDKLTNAFIGMIDKCEKINPYDQNTKNIIYDYIENPNYIDIYYSIIYE